MHVVITGGRDYTDRRRIFEALNAIHANRQITHLSHGGCRGADRLGAAWADTQNIPTTPYPADWDNLDVPGARIRWNPAIRKFYNAAAGHQRNRRMLETAGPDLVVAFPGGDGTANCVATAFRLHIAVMSVDA